jgi:hypothetical protein
MPACSIRKPPKEDPSKKGTSATPAGRRNGFVDDPNTELRGAVSGSLLGGAIGKVQLRSDRGPAETKLAHKSQAEQGVCLELESVNMSKVTVGTDRQLVLYATYALIVPRDQEQIEVAEIRLVTLDGNKVVEVRASANRGTGTYTTRVPVTLPTPEPRGRYDIQVIITAANEERHGKASCPAD